MKFIFRNFGLTLALLSFSSGALAEDKTFNKPHTGEDGDRIDICLNYGRDCGQVVADMFCKKWRFSYARDFRADPSVGKTRLITKVFDIDRDVVCNGSHCTGFKYITCSGDLPYTQVFSPPAWKGYRLDYCLTWAKNCGQPAADAFCRTQGFSKSVYWRRDPYVGQQPTRVITTDQICKGSFCTTFQTITCT